MNIGPHEARDSALSTGALIEAYFLGELTDEQIQVLEVRLLVDPGARAAFHREAAHDAALRTIALDQRLDRGPVPVCRASRRRVLGMAASLAVLLAGAASTWWLTRDDASVARLVTSSSEAHIRFEGHDSPAAKGTRIGNGGELLVARGGEGVSFRLRDGSRFQASAGTRVRIARVGGQYRLNLITGMLEADIEKQPPGKQLLITTAGSTVKVLGTRLTLYGDGDASRLIVTHGQVELIRNSDKQVLLVGDEQTAQVVPGVHFSVIDISGLETRDIEVLEARFGTGEDWVDVTEPLRSRVQHRRLIPIGIFNTLAGDPAENRPKTLEVRFRVDGREGFRRYPEYLDFEERWYATDIILPLPGVPDFEGAQWVWDAEAGFNAGDWRFRKIIDLPEGPLPERAEMLLTVDNNWVLFINGEPVGRSARTVDDEQGESVWLSPGLLDITAFLRPGSNTVTVDGTNRIGTRYGEPTPAGLLAMIRLDYGPGRAPVQWVSDGSWESLPLDASGHPVPPAEWQPVEVLGDHGIQPWGSLDAAFRLTDQVP